MTTNTKQPISNFGVPCDYPDDGLGERLARVTSDVRAGRAALFWRLDEKGQEFPPILQTRTSRFPVLTPPLAMMADIRYLAYWDGRKLHPYKRPILNAKKQAALDAQQAELIKPGVPAGYHAMLVSGPKRVVNAGYLAWCGGQQPPVPVEHVSAEHIGTFCGKLPGLTYVVYRNDIERSGGSYTVPADLFKGDTK